MSLEEKQLQDYPSKDAKQKLRELCYRDPTVLYAFRYREQSGQPYEEMLENLVVLLAKEKETWQEQAVKMTSMSLQPPTVAIPTRNIVIQLGLWQWIKHKLFGRGKI